MARTELTRRQAFIRLGQLGGAAAMIQGMTALGFLAGTRSAHAATTGPGILPPQSGVGKKVAIIGAGVSGFTSAYELTLAGYEVTILEANDRMGGRSLTVRRGDSYQEVGGPRLTCEFEEVDSNGNAIYLNAGPGRIPQHHNLVLAYCREWGVALEPYIFACRANLLQADDFNGGQPMPLRQMKHNLRGEIAEMLAKSVRKNELDRRMTQEEQQLLLDMLKAFGDLTAVNARFSNNAYACDKLSASSEQIETVLRFCGTSRAGYSQEPGVAPGVLKPQVSLYDILFSELWDTELFNDMRYYWQTSLMQPIGGMDNIWKKAQAQPVPGSADKTLGDLVKLNSPVTRIWVREGAVEVTTRVEGAEEVNSYDFCISTIAPSQMDKYVSNNFSTEFQQALANSHKADIAACKVGWQSRNRFWEYQDHIYGGISWTKHIISQMWYPSNSFHADIGVLTGAYNREETAIRFGNLSHKARLAAAIEGGRRLHPGFEQHIDVKKGLSIAWQKMRFFSAGWQHASDHPEEIYKPLLQPQGNFFMSGDVMSHNGGWMQGSMQSAQYVVSQINQRVAQQKHWQVNPT